MLTSSDTVVLVVDDKGTTVRAMSAVTEFPLPVGAGHLDDVVVHLERLEECMACLVFFSDSAAELMAREDFSISSM